MTFENWRSSSIRILGVNINDCSTRDILMFIQEKVNADQKAIISYVNVHAINLAYQMPWFRAFLNQSDINFCDGFGIKWAARIIGFRLLHRNTPPDWIDALCTLCTQEGFSLYLLGAKPGVAQRASEILTNRHPGLIIAGTHHGYFEKHHESEVNRMVVASINARKTNILLIGFGMPLQEQWIIENLSELHANIILPVGALIDYVAGEVVRAPRWMTDHGLEWLGRFVIEPRRLWKRYLIGNPVFLWRILLQKMNVIKLPD